MANNYINKVVFGSQTLLDVSQDTVTSSNLLSGATAHGPNGPVTGACTYDADTTTQTPASASEILTGKEAYANGSKVTGTMPNRGAVSGTISSKNTPYSVPAGYHDGSGTVGLDSTEAAKLIPGNIKAGVTLFSVEGEYTGEAISVQSDKTATPSTSSQTILPDTGYDYLSQVVVAAIPYSETATTGTTGYTATIG